MMKRASIRIKGNVQMAGFQTFIKNTADSLNVNGFAENLEEGSVRVVCEGEERAIEGLINSVKQNPPSFVRIGEVSEKIDGSKEEIVTQISSLRDDLRSYMEYKFAKIEHEVEAIKAKIGMV